MPDLNRNRAFDSLRRNRRLQEKLDFYGRERGDALEVHAPDFSAQVALTVKLLAGLSTDEVARAFGVSETMAQRLVRAKRTLSAAHVPFEAPQADELVLRLNSVLKVIYLIFNEGYSATSGTQWLRTDLCEEARRQ